MKKVLGSILLVAYSIVAIAVTVLLLSYNEYNCSELGGYTVYLVNDDSLEPEYKQGSILLIKHTSDKNVQKGDEMFLYKVINSQEYEFVKKTLLNKTQQGNHITYVVDNSEAYANDYFVGKTTDTVVIEGWGYLLGLLESKWGYLFCVVIVSLMLFLQEVFELGMEIKYGREVKKARMAKQHENGKSEVIETDYEVKTEDKPRATTKTTSKLRTATTEKTTTKPRTTSTTKTASKPRTSATAKNESKSRTVGTGKKTGSAKAEGSAKITEKASTVDKESVKDENKANSEEE